MPNEPEFPIDPDPDEDDDDDFDDDLEDDDDEYEPFFTIYWLSTAPITSKAIAKWESLHHLAIEVDAEEAYIYWEVEETGVTKAEACSIAASRSFSLPLEQVWDYVQDEGQAAKRLRVWQ